MGMGFDPTWLRQVSPPPLLHKTTLTAEKTPAEYASLEHVAWKTIRFTRDGSTDSHCRFIIHASSRIGLRPAPSPHSATLTKSGLLTYQMLLHAIAVEMAQD